MSNNVMAQLQRITVEGESIACEFGKSSNKGTDQVVANLKILDGPHEGKVVPWIGYFTEKTLDRTIESLRNLGLKGDDITGARTQPMDNVVPVTVEEETYEGKTRLRIGFINKPGSGGGLVMEKRLSKDERPLFAARLRAKLAAAGEVTPAPVASTTATNGKSKADLADL